MQISYKHTILIFGLLLVLGGCGDGDTGSAGAGLEITLNLEQNEIRPGQVIRPELDFINHMECDAQVTGEIRDTAEDIYGGVDTQTFDFIIQGAEVRDGTPVRLGKETLIFDRTSYSEGGLFPVVTAEVNYKCLDDRGAVANSVCIDEDRCELFGTVNQVERDNLPVEVGRVDKEFIETDGGSNELILTIGLKQRAGKGEPNYEGKNKVLVRAESNAIGEFDCNPSPIDLDSVQDTVECRIEVEPGNKNDKKVHITLDYEFSVSISKNVNIKNEERFE